MTLYSCHLTYIIALGCQKSQCATRMMPTSTTIFSSFISSLLFSKAEMPRIARLHEIHQHSMLQQCPAKRQIGYLNTA